MKAFRVAPLCVLLLGALSFAAPPKLDIPAEVKPVDGYATYQPPGDVKEITYISLDGLSLFPAAFLKDSKSFVVPTKGEKQGRYRFIAVASNNKGEQSRADFVVPIGDAPVPPPKPVDPDVKPAEELKTFRVIEVHESGTTLTQAQFAVAYAKKIGDWLDANTTKDGDTGGWRRYDPDTVGGSDKPPFNAIWTAERGNAKHLTFVVERNGKTQVVPFEATPETMIEKLSKIREGK